MKTDVCCCVCGVFSLALVSVNSTQAYKTATRRTVLLLIPCLTDLSLFLSPIYSLILVGGPSPSDLQAVRSEVTGDWCQSKWHIDEWE